MHPACLGRVQLPLQQLREDLQLPARLDAATHHRDARDVGRRKPLGGERAGGRGAKLGQPALVEKDGDGNTQRALMCDSDGLWLAKDRSGKLSAWEAPDLGAIINKIGGVK